MIALKYINKNAATAAAIRDYENMRFIINNTPQYQMNHQHPHVFNT